MSAYHIIPMEARHVDEVSALEKLCFRAPWSKHLLAAQLARADCRYILAQEAETGRIVGCAGLQVVLDEGSIDNVAVHPDLRRRGIAKALVEEFLLYAKAEKLAFLTLEVRQSNEAAIGLYEALGFQRVGLRKHYYIEPKEHALLMTRHFTPPALTLRALSLPELRQLYDTEITASFPPNERKPFSAMRGLYERGRYLPFGAVDAAGELVGYALLWSAAPQGYVLLDYFGVRERLRASGYGSAILPLLQAQFRDWDGLIIEAEAPDGGAEDVQRQRRLDFYRRAGAALLPHDAWLFGVHYRTLLLETSGRHTPGAAREAHRALYHNYFDAEIRARFVRVPFDPQRERAPAFDWGRLPRKV